MTNNYGHNYLHRPDMSLLVYGFVPFREPPVMSTVDLPAGFGSVTHPQIGYPPTPVLEPDYGARPAGGIPVGFSFCFPFQTCPVGIAAGDARERWRQVGIGGVCRSACARVNLLA